MTLSVLASFLTAALFAVFLFGRGTVYRVGFTAALAGSLAFLRHRPLSLFQERYQRTHSSELARSLLSRSDLNGDGNSLTGRMNVN